MNNEPLPTGQVNMGNIDKLDIASMIENVRKDEVPLPVQWEEFQATETKVLHRPVITIPGLAKYELDWRDTPQWYEGERQMYVMVFANVCSNYLFGVDMFTEKKKAFKVEFKPNPAFAALDCKPMPNSDKEKLKVVEAEMVDKIPEGLIPLSIVNTKQELENVLTVVEASGFDQWTNNLPNELEVANYKANGELVSRRKFRQVIRHK